MANWIPGINVGNLIKQVTQGGDQDIFDNFTVSGRAGQKQVNVPGISNNNNASISGGGSAPQTTGANDTNSSSSITYGGSGGAAAPVGNAVVKGQWASTITDLERQLGLYPGQLEAGLNQINDGFNKGQSRLNEQTSGALSKLETQRGDTKADFNGSLDDNDASARGNYDAIMSLLGRAGSRSSSAANILTPHAVAQEASKTRGKVADTYGRNVRDITVAEEDTKTNAANSLKDLEDTKRNNEYGLRQGIESGKAKTLGGIAEAKGNMALAGGANWQQAQNAMAPAQQQRNAVEAAVSTLLDQFRNPYTVKPVEVKAPTLANYAIDPTGVKVDSPSGTGMNTDTAAATQAQIAAEEKRKKDATLAA